MSNRWRRFELLLPVRLNEGRDVSPALVLKNPRLPEVDPVEVEALADSGAFHLRVPEHVKIQLRLEAIDCKEVTPADGNRKVVEYVGSIELHFKNRAGFAGALVMGDRLAWRDTYGRHGPRHHSQDSYAGRKPREP